MSLALMITIHHIVLLLADSMLVVLLRARSKRCFVSRLRDVRWSVRRTQYLSVSVFFAKDQPPPSECYCRVLRSPPE